jgi:hypothetical protein
MADGFWPEARSGHPPQAKGHQPFSCPAKSHSPKAIGLPLMNLTQPTPRRYLSLDLRDVYPGAKFRFQSLEAGEKTKYELDNREKVSTPEWYAAESLRPYELLVLTLVDDSGKLLYAPTDVIAMQSQDSRLIDLLYNAALQHCGMTNGIMKMIADAEKKSALTGSSSSPSS